jgi:hypothetical protein
MLIRRWLFRVLAVVPWRNAEMDSMASRLDWESRVNEQLEEHGARW